MTVKLQRFAQPITAALLPRLLSDPAAAPTEPVGVAADLGEVHATVRQLVKQGVQATAEQHAAWDGELVEPLHRALKALPRRAAADMRLWHWLCIVELQEFVWHRWYGHVPGNPGEVLGPSLAGRFLGSRSLHGVSRNALARLYWCAETLYSEGDGYRLAREAVAKQDFFQAIFERRFGLYPAAAQACLEALRDASEDQRREATRRLNHYLTTIVVETLTQEDIRQLLVR